MPVKEMIAASDFCNYYQIEITVIQSLHGAGLIEMVQTGEGLFVREDELPHLEKLVRLYELGINVEGIETITHLLDQLKKLQHEVRFLANRVHVLDRG